MRCVHCGGECRRTFTDGRCAECERVYARTLPPPAEACERSGCDSGRAAVYFPGLKLWLCPACRPVYTLQRM